MTIDIGNVVVSEATPSGAISSDPSMDDWVWLKPSTGIWYNFDAATSQWVAVEHLHTTQGLTGEYEGTFKKIKVENGLVIEFELE